MAKEENTGVYYYPMDVTIYRNRKVWSIERACGPDIMAVLPAILCVIYEGKGYFMHWNYDAARQISMTVLFGKENNKHIRYVESVVNEAIKYNFFSKEMLENHGIITSESIQAKYETIIARRKYNRIVNYRIVKNNYPCSECGRFYLRKEKTDSLSDMNEEMEDDPEYKKESTNQEDQKKAIVSASDFVAIMKEDFNLFKSFMEDANCGESSAINLLDKFERNENDKPYKTKELWKWKQDFSDWWPRKGLTWLRSTGRIAEVTQKNKEKERAIESSIPPPIVQPEHPVQATEHEKTSYGEFVSLSESEHNSLIHEFGEVWTSWMISEMNNYKGSSGIKNESDFYAIKFHGVKWMEHKKEKEKKKEEKQTDPVKHKRKPTLDYYSNFDLSFVEPELQEPFKLWLEYKLERGERYKSNTTVKSPYRKLISLLKNTDNRALRATEIIDHAITSGWAGIYDEVNYKKQTNGNKYHESTQAVATTTIYDDSVTFG